MSLDVDTIAAGLMSQYGISRELARTKAQQIAGIPTASDARPVVEIEAMPAIQWPVRMTLPWSFLIADNRKYAPAMRGDKPVMLLTQPYRIAKRQTFDLARATLGLPRPEPAAIPLSIEAAVWVPDNHIHDSCNFAKCVHDALEDTVYTKDRWLKRVLWYEAGVDCDRPRADVTIRPLSPKDGSHV